MIAKSLEGTWLSEQLAIVARQLADWEHVEKQMAVCDKDLAALLKEIPTAEAKPMAPVAPVAPVAKTGRRRRKSKSKSQPAFDITAELRSVAGVDLTRIDGVKEMTVQTLIAEAGLDMSPWPSEHHFVSWIGLAPRNEISGGKVLKKKTRKVVSRLATPLRIGAASLRESQSYLRAQYRRLRGRLASPKAITAMAAKLARLVYRMLKYGQEYVDKGTALYEENYRLQNLKMITRQTAQHGFALVPLVAAA
jgi:transposase